MMHVTRRRCRGPVWLLTVCFALGYTVLADAAATSTRASLYADLELALGLSSDEATVGDMVTVTLKAYNYGPRDALGVAVRYALPAGLTFVSAAFSDATDTYNPSTGLWTIGTFPEEMLMPVPTMQLTVSARVTAPGTSLHSAEVVASSRPDPDSEPDNGAMDEDDYDEAALVAYPAPVVDLLLEKHAGSAGVAPGARLEYTLSYTNAGDAVTGVVLQERLPAHTTFDPAASTSGWQALGDGVYELRLGTLDAGHAGEATFSVLVDGSISGVSVLENTATIRDDGSRGAEATPENNIATVETSIAFPAEADLSLAIEDAVPTTVSEEVTIALILANTGPDDATGTVVSAHWPEGLHLVTSDAPHHFEETAAGTGVWIVDVLATGSEEQVHLTFRVEQPGMQLVEAFVVATDQPDPDSVPGTSTGEDDATVAAIEGRLAAPNLMDPGNSAEEVPLPAHLKWVAVPGAQRYRVEVAEAGTSFHEPTFTVETTGQVVEATSLLEGTAYQWRVQALAGTVEGPWSAVGSFTTLTSSVGTATTIAPDLAEPFVSAPYPNPFATHTQIVVHVPQAQAVRVVVHDVRGRQVAVLWQGVVPASQQQVIPWQAGNHASGLYFIRIEGEYFARTQPVTLVK
jgi:uncharacterized repeat protein (TIGR01451 family)